MGKLVVTEFVSVDGVFEDPGGAEGYEYGGWTFEYNRGEDGDQFKVDELMEADVQLLGRRTYEGFAAAWPSREGLFADKINNGSKYVVSNTLTDPEWQNTKAFSSFRKLRSMHPKQFEFPVVDVRDVDDHAGTREMMQKVIQVSRRLVWWIRVVRLSQGAMHGGVANETAGRCMVGVAVLPIGRQHQLRTVPPNNARNLLTVLYGIDDSAVSHAEIFTKPGTHSGCGVLRLFVALLARASRSHFTSGEIHNTE